MELTSKTHLVESDSAKTLRTAISIRSKQLKIWLTKNLKRVLALIKELMRYWEEQAAKAAEIERLRALDRSKFHERFNYENQIRRFF